MKTILVADDNRGIREYCRAVFEEEGYRVVLACDGAEAVLAFREEAPDVVILDVRMPRLSGLEALEQIKAICPQVPAIIFTANDEDCLQDQRERLATACIEKSEDLTALQRAVVRGLRAESPRSDAPTRHTSLPAHPCPG